MCDRPILIDNPYLGLSSIGYNYLHDTTSLKIPVPCGNCPTCIALRQSYFIQRTQMQAMDNHLFMATFTYRQSMIPKKKVNGYTLYYPDFKDVQNMFKRLRNRGLKFSYLVCSEYGGNHHRPHFHALISVPKGPKDDFHDIMNLETRLSNMFLGEWRRNYGSDKKPKYKSLCQLVVTPYGRTYDFHYINNALSDAGESDVGFYVTKYIFKSDKWVDRLKSALRLNNSPDDFVELWKLFKPRCCISKNWGNPKSPLVSEHIRKGINLALDCGSEFPFFINPLSGQTFPLSPYYQRKFLTMQDKHSFFYLSDNQVSFDGYTETAERNLTHERSGDLRLQKIRNLIDSRLNSYDDSYDSENFENFLPEQQKENPAGIDYVDDNWSEYSSDFDN